MCDKFYQKIHIIYFFVIKYSANIFRKEENMKKFLIALSLCASTAVFASDADYNWEFTPTVGGVMPEGSSGLRDSFVYGLRIAKNFENAFVDQLELGYDRVSDFDLKYAGSEPNLNMYHANLVKNLVNFSDNFKLYGLAGLGYMDFSKDVEGADKSGGFAQYGLGLKYYWAENFATKLEARHVMNWDEGDDFMFYTLGFGVDFGKRYAAAAAPSVGDEDGDGVLDNVDRCPGTPKGVVVDEYGCEKVIRLDLGVNFAFDSAKIKPEYMDKIRTVSSFMAEHNDYTVLLEGNTDSVGSEAYNKKLSEKRAAAVAEALMSLGVSADKITTSGLGESNPIADNSTAAGRAQNRRVDAKFRK